MKKLQFGIQIVILMAAFPILLIAGIRGPKSKIQKQDVKKEAPVTIKKDREVKKVFVHMAYFLTKRKVIIII